MPKDKYAVSSWRCHSTTLGNFHPSISLANLYAIPRQMTHLTASDGYHLARADPFLFMISPRSFSRPPSFVLSGCYYEGIFPTLDASVFVIFIDVRSPILNENWINFFRNEVETHFMTYISSSSHTQKITHVESVLSTQLSRREQQGVTIIPYLQLLKRIQE